MRPARKGPLIFAHRGASRVAPENTLPAFEAAVRLGVDGVELDVQRSADGHLVVFHNLTLNACTNGRGKVATHTLAELRALDAGSWFSPDFAGTKIPTLDEALDLLAGQLLVNIELKSLDLSSASIGAQVARSVRACRMEDQVVLSSFNPFALRSAKVADPDIECALLVAPGWLAWLGCECVRRFSQADGLHPELSLVDAAYLRRARTLGLPIRVWTVNEEDDLRRMLVLGVDAIITDVPDRLAGLSPVRATSATL